GAAFDATGDIAERFADVGDGELDALLLEGVGQQAKRRFLDRALAGVGIGGLEVVGLLVLLLRKRGRRRGEKQQGEKQPSHDQNPAEALCCNFLRQSQPPYLSGKLTF